jgi:hypothetical protein
MINNRNYKILNPKIWKIHYNLVRYKIQNKIKQILTTYEVLITNYIKKKACSIQL